MHVERWWVTFQRRIVLSDTPVCFSISSSATPCCNSCLTWLRASSGYALPVTTDQQACLVPRPGHEYAPILMTAMPMSLSLALSFKVTESMGSALPARLSSRDPFRQPSTSHHDRSDWPWSHFLSGHDQSRLQV